MTDFTICADDTLADAIADMRRQVGDDDMTEDMDEHSHAAFLMHDAVHVLFGCDDSLAGEIKAHAWMALGTTAPIDEMHRAVASREHRSVLSGIGHIKLVGTWLRLAPRLVQIALRARGMAQKLPYEAMDALMARTVATIREDYRIRPL